MVPLPRSPRGHGTEEGAQDVDGTTTQEPHEPPWRGRLTERVLGGGEDPDPRFTLANERTFLAWIRTSLAFLAGGIAIEAFTGELFDEPVRTFLAVVLLLLSMLVSAGATFRWIGVERSMRRQAPLPLPLIAPLLAVGGAVAAGVLVVVVLQA
ncbi:YidH family protein [Kocuria flava]|uniref:DUF202 domain-containing protein n=1 Tax=Kocuria flava TaxID=446860 RepID=A0ABQ0X603_9MICC|nr:DUF202 domain-containing protein [Kocuria flava]GEO93066.1 hypothetical protein KFL01_23720 [Kocuria flava]